MIGFLAEEPRRASFLHAHIAWHSGKSKTQGECSVPICPLALNQLVILGHSSDVLETLLICRRWNKASP